MPLANRNNHPPGGGFSFFQPQTKWHLKGGLPFAMAVDAIIKHRLANPHIKLSTDKDVVADELDAFTCARLKHDPQWCTQKKTTSHLDLQIPTFEKPPVIESDAPPVDVGKVQGESRHLLWSWLGQGLPPVDKTVAEARAEVCCHMHSGKKCHLNVPGNLLERVTGLIGEAIHSTMELKEGMKLRTKYDSQLGTCDACGCHLPLKVWVSKATVSGSLPNEIRSRLPAKCWMLSP